VEVSVGSETEAATKRVQPARTTVAFRRLSGRLSKSAGWYGTIEVISRSSGTPQSVTLFLIGQGGAWYVCSFSGAADWVRNVRSAGKANFTRRGRTIPVQVVEVDGEERDRVQRKYRQWMGPLQRDFNRLLDAADHPTFRLDADSR
jgi:hypothetical protein